MIGTIKIGNTGLELSRVMIGTGSDNGHVFDALGKEDFIKTLHYAFERGIKAIDTSEAYTTFPWIPDALKGHDDVKVQFKITRAAERTTGDIIFTVDKLRADLGRDQIDSILLHCMDRDRWPDHYRSHMEYMAEARATGVCSAIGASCHNSMAVRELNRCIGWVDLLLARANPFGVRMDAQEGQNDAPDGTNPLTPLEHVREVKRRTGCAVYAMKILGDGKFIMAERFGSLRWIMRDALFDGYLVGLKTTQEVDEFCNNFKANT